MSFTGKKIFMLTKSPNAVSQVGADDTPVVSETYVDLPNYDNGNFRDEFTPFSNIAVLNTNVATAIPYLVKSTTAGAITSASIPAATITGDDRLMHIDPRNELKKRTMIKFWSGAAGTGDQLGEVWADRFVQWTGFQPVRF